MQKRTLRVTLVFAVILAACAGYWGYVRSGSDTGPASGGGRVLQPAPDFSLKDSSGQVHTMRETRGKTVLVHFWAAWCPPCLQEIPNLVAFARDFQNNPHLEIVAISMDPKWSDAQKVLPTTKLPKNMISLLNAGSKTPDRFGTYQFPETYLVNPQGKVVTKWVGGQPWNSPSSEKVMRKVIQQESRSS